MLRTFLEPEMQRLGAETHTLWFQQDGAMTHTARTAMRILNKTFPARVISRRGSIEWPATLPDFNACNFFLWGNLKSKMYEMKSQAMVALKQNIRDEVAANSPTMLQRVMQNFQKRLQESVDKGCHLTDTLFRK